MMLRFLSNARLLLVVPVVSCVLLTAAVVIMGVARIVTGAGAILAKGDYSAKTAKILCLAVIEIIDLFLVGTVAYITAIGIYRLFISRSDVGLPMRLKIDSLKDLEDKIIGVLVAALAVAFLGHAAGGDEAQELLNYGGGIALVIAALAFFTMTGAKAGKPDGDA